MVTHFLWYGLGTGTSSAVAGFANGRTQEGRCTLDKPVACEPLDTLRDDLLHLLIGKHRLQHFPLCILQGLAQTAVFAEIVDHVPERAGDSLPRAGHDEYN